MDSTQDLVRAWAREGRPEGVAVATDRQVAGRGRLGRRWECPPGAGLQLSVLLRPAVAPARLPWISLAAAVAVHDVLGPVFAIKWPNDILAPDGRKVAGVLAEAEVTGGRVDAVVVGVGINLTGAPPLPTAGAVADWAPAPDAPALAAALLAALLRRSQAVAAAPAGVLADWRAADRTVGRRVTVGEGTGIAEGVAEDGSLWVRLDDGRVWRVTAGDVVWAEQEGR